MSKRVKYIKICFNEFLLSFRSLQGKPLPSLYWQKEGINITDRVPNDQEFMDEDKPDEANTDIEMILNNVMYEQEGNYSCIGTNIVGEDRYDFYLEVQREFGLYCYKINLSIINMYSLLLYLKEFYVLLLIIFINIISFIR